jgi:hypothetical protein
MTMVEKINIVLKKSSYCFARFRLLVFGESIAQEKIPLMRFLIYQKIRLLFYGVDRSPQVIEDQVTYPLVSNLGVPKVKISGFFGMSFIYIIF